MNLGVLASRHDLKVLVSVVPPPTILVMNEFVPGNLLASATPYQFSQEEA